MRLVNLLLSASLASAQVNRLLPGTKVAYVGELAPRDLIDGGSGCTRLDTCGECFGDGYVLCDNAGCFNPDDGEQCCKGGSMCVGLNSSCCARGPGKPGKDGVVPYPGDTSDDDYGEDDEDSGSSWTCNSAMSGEDCCSRGGDSIHWCAGSFPNNMCYNSSEQICCSDGHICFEKDCCDIVHATPTTPWLSLTTKSGSESSTSAPSTTTSTSTSASESDSDSASDATATTDNTSTSPTPTNAGETLVVIKGASALLGALAVGFFVL